MVRIPKHSAGTFLAVDGRATKFAACWQLKVPLGCAPGFSAECQGLLTILPKPQPKYAYPLSRLVFVNATKNCTQISAHFSDSVLFLCESSFIIYKPFFISHLTAFSSACFSQKLNK